MGRTLKYVDEREDEKIMGMSSGRDRTGFIPTKRCRDGVRPRYTKEDPQGGAVFQTGGPGECRGIGIPCEKERVMNPLRGGTPNLGSTLHGVLRLGGVIWLWPDASGRGTPFFVNAPDFRRNLRKSFRPRVGSRRAWRGQFLSRGRWAAYRGQSKMMWDLDSRMGEESREHLQRCGSSMWNRW